MRLSLTQSCHGFRGSYIGRTESLGLDEQCALQVMGDGSEAAGEGNKFTADLMDQFFRDPNMQQLLYKYLPEPMRNPQTFEWMLSNPEYRKQLEGMMEQQVCVKLPLTHTVYLSCPEGLGYMQPPRQLKRCLNLQ